MKRVLVVFPLLHHLPLVKGICKALNENGMEANALYWVPLDVKFYSFSNITESLSYFFFTILYRIIRRLPGAWRIGLAGYLKNKCYSSLLKKYDAVMLAGVYNNDKLELAKYAKLHNKKIIISLWGGDFYFINDYVNDWRNQLFELSDLIICGSLTMKRDFDKAYHCYAEKAKPQPYGLSQFEMLKELKDGAKKSNISFLDERFLGKSVITIGYSGRPWQQHFYALDAIERLPQAVKDNLFLLLPMTYDCEWHYKSYIQYRLDEIGVPYQILSDRLSLEQNLSMRMSSDILIVVQKADAMSASVQEHLMAGSVLIAGEWLPYNELNENGVYFKKTNLSDLFENIRDVISNLSAEKEKCRKNTEIMYSLRSWESVGPKFVKLIQDSFKI